MWKILKGEARRLGRDEGGVALMMTLSVIMLLYVACAGVYATGETVRRKIEVQNAVDAAAYSAAVVQADALGRMAMLNRALAWTYVQTVNMQIDYITYKFLKTVAKRFREDQAMCRGWNSASMNCIAIPPGIVRKCRTNSAFTKEGTGWFCGTLDATKALGFISGAEPHNGAVCINGHGGSKAIPVENLEASLSGDTETVMEQYPDAIAGYQGMTAVYNHMLADIATGLDDVLTATIVNVLGRNLPRLKDGSLEGSQDDDFMYYIGTRAVLGSPYVIEDMADDEEFPIYFSPLSNTEADEMRFLAMADGEVHNTLLEYFGSSGSDSNVAGGLDQWFIRCDRDEPASLERQVRPKLMTEKIPFGICRGYKHANRVSTGGKSIWAYRGHHNAVNGDDDPSCINTHGYCPEQCDSAPDSVALYADWEWISGQYTFLGAHMHSPKDYNPIPTHDFHFHTYSAKYLSSCSHHSCSCSGGDSHTREEYKSCITKGKMFLPLVLGFGGEMADSMFNFNMPMVVRYFSCRGDDTDWKVVESSAKIRCKKPNGYSRVYGDDREIYNSAPQAFVGVPAQPWVLNDKFFAGWGTITVGFARKASNPFDTMLGTVTGETGFHSIFTPMRNHWTVAFASARAGYKAKGDGDKLNYQVAYDDPCENLGDGCVCNNAAVKAALSRQWNLCTTDWDATLLPVAHADETYGESSYTPIVNAYVSDLPWYSLDGERKMSGTFLAMPSPVGSKTGVLYEPKIL